KYAQKKRNSVSKIGDETLERLRAEVREIEADLRKAEGKQEELAPQLEPLKARRDQLVKDLGSFQGGSYANLRDLMETRGKLERERDRIQASFTRLLREELALALAGADLREKLRSRVVGEEER